jgi:hypothetical protein
MKNLVFGTIALSLICLPCNSNSKQHKIETVNARDKVEIQKLIRKVLNWSKSDSSFHNLQGFDFNNATH